jgi:hypothetical protein
VYATFFGGRRTDLAYEIAAGPYGFAYIVGETTSDDFPVTPGSAQQQLGGVVDLGPLQYGDGFLVRLSADGSRAVYSTYLGGPAADRLYSVAVEPDGAAFVAGRTEDAGVLPASLGDALLARYEPSGRLLRQSRIGSPGTLEYGTGTAVAAGRIFGSVIGSGILELHPETLEPLRRAVPRVSGIAAIAASATNTVHVLSPETTSRPASLRLSLEDKRLARSIAPSTTSMRRRCPPSPRS